MLSSAIALFGMISMLIGGMGNNGMTPVGNWFSDNVMPFVYALEPFLALSS